jgi:hypothetical protein
MAISAASNCRTSSGTTIRIFHGVEERMNGLTDEHEHEHEQD